MIRFPPSIRVGLGSKERVGAKETIIPLNDGDRSGFTSSHGSNDLHTIYNYRSRSTARSSSRTRQDQLSSLGPYHPPLPGLTSFIISRSLINLLPIPSLRLSPISALHLFAVPPHSPVPDLFSSTSSRSLPLHLIPIFEHPTVVHPVAYAAGRQVGRSILHRYRGRRGQ